MCGDGKQSYRSQGYEPRPATELWEQSPMNKEKKKQENENETRDL